MARDKHLQKRALIRIYVVAVLLAAGIFFSFIGLTKNSQGAKDRYDTLISVDEAGGDVETALNDLRTYIYSHMNTQIGSDLGIRPPIQLKGTYDRLVTTEEERVTKAGEALYATAQADCESRLPTGFSGSNRLACIEAYVDSNAINSQDIEDDFYKFDFAPPIWSADLAGISIIFSGILGFMLAVDILLYFRTRHTVQM
ncbi:MAG: hypothetical protein ACI9T8_000280 [Candidatus Saccharimonadales bacterium]|jgi:hypothetical protein